MNTFNWTKIMQPNILILKLGGVWPFSTTTNFNRKLSKSYSIVLMFLIVSSALLQTVELLFFTTNRKIFLASSCLVIQEYQLEIKMFCLLKNFHILEDLLQELNDEILFQPKTQQQKSFILDGLSLWRKSFIVLNTAAFVTIFCWTLFPVFDNLTSQYELPFRSWYPYNYKTSPLYEISYVYEFLHLWVSAFVTHNIDTLVTVLMTFIGLQCDLLCDNLKKVGYSKGENLDIDKELNKCILHHKKILRFSENCIKFFSLIIFVEVATISVCIGISLLHLTFVPLFTTEFYQVFFYEITILIQIFQYCWFGSEVLAKSGKIPESAFQINFIAAPLKVKKNLIFFIARSQRPIKIPVLKLTHLSLEIFTKILRTAYSYFTLLNEVSERDN